MEDDTYRLVGDLNGERLRRRLIVADGRVHDGVVEGDDAADEENDAQERAEDDGLHAHVAL